MIHTQPTVNLESSEVGLLWMVLLHVWFSNIIFFLLFTYVVRNCRLHLNNILNWEFLSFSRMWRCIVGCMVPHHYDKMYTGGASKFIAQPGRKQATATKLGIYSTRSPRSSIHFLARCSNFCKPLKKISEGCPSNRVSATAMTSTSDEKWSPMALPHDGATFFIWHGGHCCRGHPVGWTIFWNFFEWLAKVRATG